MGALQRNSVFRTPQGVSFQEITRSEQGKEQVGEGHPAEELLAADGVSSAAPNLVHI